MEDLKKLIERVDHLNNLFPDMESLKLNLKYEDDKLSLHNSDIVFTSGELEALEKEFGGEDAMDKVSQSDVPNNMLALLAALRASTAPKVS